MKTTNFLNDYVPPMVHMHLLTEGSVICLSGANQDFIIDEDEVEF